MAKAVKEAKDEPLEKQLWKAADKLRKNIDDAMDAIEKENPSLKNNNC
jgi:phosphate uptake regulator